MKLLFIGILSYAEYLNILLYILQIVKH